MSTPLPRKRLLGRYRARDVVVGSAFLLPAMIVFVVFIFYPLFTTFWLSFHSNDLLGRPKFFVGLTQYTKVFSDPYLLGVLGTTGLFLVLTVLPGMLVGLGLALLVQPKLPGIGIFRGLLASPFAFSAAAAAVVFNVFYRPGTGLFNGILHNLGIGQVEWLTNPDSALASIAVVAVWRYSGYTMLVCLAGLQAIPEDLYEAAKIDGASPWRQFVHVTLPLLTPTLFFLIVVSTVHALQTFGEIKLMTGGGPSNSTTTLVYSLYKSAFAFGSSDYGLASAQGVILMVVVAAITIIQFTVLQRKVFYG